MNRALTISGSDSLGIVGIQKDIEIFLKNDIQSSSVVTSIIAQNTIGSFKIESISKAMIKNQIKIIFEEQDFDAVKIGTVVGTDEIKLIGKVLRKIKGIPNIILNPQIININGDRILSDNEKKALIKELFPITYLLILNKEDIEELLDKRIRGTANIEDILEEIKKFGPMNILVRNLKDEKGQVDILYDGEELTYFISEDLGVKDTYILGERLSAAITSAIANKYSVKSAIRLGKEFIVSN